MSVLNYLDVVNMNEKVSVVYKLIDIFEVRIGDKNVKIKILQDIKSSNGMYYYQNSHWYHGTEQVAAYISSRNGFNNKEEALQNALRELTIFYREDDENAKWVENERFL